MSKSNQEPTEEEIIRRSKENHLYSHDFGGGRYFQVVHEDKNGFEVRLAPRTMFKVVYIKNKGDIEGLEIIKLVNKDEKERVKLNKFNFAQLKAFLAFIDEIDLGAITERRLKLDEENKLDEGTKKKIKTLLAQEGGEEIIESLISEGIVTSKDIVNTGYRKRQINEFKRLLTEKNYWKQYSNDEEINSQKEEKTWQHFFSKNEWIFGYGLDYRFQGILQKEFHASSTEADGSSAVIGDFLIGDKRFTTFVEIKKPSTPLFGNSKNRSNAWALSNDLIDSVSQILEQKASGQIRLEQKDLHDDKGEPIIQKSYDSKVILIIGNWDKVTYDNPKEKIIKGKTFELYRRDSRNVEIITYDELYNRAKFIANQSIK
ncbi:Shedu immune nuclease family protein [Fodinibius halophilus]|uniref:DUF4263 domain-containing protein n=1 Tax=Fodinibius halophilus TaxID=1736908 RepID=A0A6M1T4L3_9BACT|nr:Shedu immune nuclease family protein [Fodinibius halophilus]NGP88987.1 DUF4263 domain-containing protein [Fodinibius halophilus]